MLAQSGSAVALFFTVNFQGPFQPASSRIYSRNLPHDVAVIANVQGAYDAVASAANMSILRPQKYSSGYLTPVRNTTSILPNIRSAMAHTKSDALTDASGASNAIENAAVSQSRPSSR